MIPRSAALDVPFHPDTTGRIATTWDLPRQLAIRLRSIIGTAPGERVMRPTYGCGAGLHVFDINDQLRASLLASTIKDAITKWEPAVVVEDVAVERVDLNLGLLQVRINYRLVTTGEPQVALISVSPTASSGWPS